MHGSRRPRRAPQAPARTAFPPCSLTSFSHDSAWSHVIYFDLGTESSVLESDRPNSGKCRASPSREGRIPSSRRAGSIGNHPQRRNPGGRQLPLLRLQLRTRVASAALCSLQGTRLPQRWNPAQPSRSGQLERGKPGSHCRAPAAPTGCPQAPLDAPAPSPIRGLWLQQLSQVPAPASSPPAMGSACPGGTRLRPAKLSACGPPPGAQLPLPPHPCHRTGQSPEPSATAPLPSQGARKGLPKHRMVLQDSPTPGRSLPGPVPARSGPTTGTDGTPVLG